MYIKEEIKLLVFEEDIILYIESKRIYIYFYIGIFRMSLVSLFGIRLICKKFIVFLYVINKCLENRNVL